MTDHNNLDDIEHGDLGQEHDEIEGAPAGGLKANLANAWRTQPLVKLIVLIVVVAAIIGIVMSLFSSNPANERKSATSLGSVPNLHEAPGGKASEYVKEETRMANEQREKEALKQGTSSMPTPIGSDNEAKKDDPLNELRAEIENLTKEVNRPKPTPPPAPQPVQQQPVQQPEVFDEGLSKAMQKQMSDLMGDWRAKSIKVVGVSKGTAGDGDDTNGTSKDAATQQAAATKAADGADNGSPPAKILIPAGTISYAKLLTEANSDVPGPILAQIVSGPLNGARAVGKFTVENAYSDYLVLRFYLAELNGKEYQINTLAIDPDTSLGGMATDVDERYFERVFLPAAASFLQGLGQQMSNGDESITTTGTTTITTQGTHGIRQGIYAGLGTAANTVAQFAQNQANNTKPLVVVAAGTPMGLMFVTSVKDAPAPAQKNARGQTVQAPSGLAGYSSSDSSLGYDPNANPTLNQANSGQIYGNNNGTGSMLPFTMPTSSIPMIYNPSQYSSYLPGISSTTH